MGLHFSAGCILSQPASGDSGKSQTYGTMISALQTHESGCFSFVMILRWITHTSMVAAHLQCSTCHSVFMCLCVSELMGF